MSNNGGVGTVETGVVAAVRIAGFAHCEVFEIGGDIAGGGNGVFVGGSGSELAVGDGFVFGDGFDGGIGDGI